MRAAGLRIKEWREKAGMSQQALADHAGIAPATVSGLENGRDGVSLDKLALLAEAFGCNLSDLFAEAGPKPTKYAELIAAWNALPSQKARQTLLTVIREWAGPGKAAARPQ